MDIPAENYDCSGIHSAGKVHEEALQSQEKPRIPQDRRHISQRGAPT
jgi:hypothetical protein